MVTNKAYCKQHVYSGERWDFTGHQCNRKPLPGTEYCKQHQPDNVAAKRLEKEARWAKQTAYSEWLQGLKDIRRKLAAACLEADGPNHAVIDDLVLRYRALEAKAPEKVDLPEHMRVRL